MSSGASGWLLIRVQNTSSPPPICRSAGQKLISMLMVLTNVLRWGCHFWADLNCRPELNCSVNYHIIAFSAVIYLHVEAGALQLVGRGVCAAGLTQTLQDVSPLANISLHPPPHTHTRFMYSPYFSQLVSFFSHFFLTFSSSFTCFYSFIYCQPFFSSTFLWCFHFLLCTFHLPFSISVVFEGDDSEVPSGLYSSSPSQNTHTQAHKRKLTSALLSHFLFFIPAFGTFCLLLSIYKFHCIILHIMLMLYCLNMPTHTRNYQYRLSVLKKSN